MYDVLFQFSNNIHLIRNSYFGFFTIHICIKHYLVSAMKTMIACDTHIIWRWHWQDRQAGIKTTSLLSSHCHAETVAGENNLVNSWKPQHRTSAPVPVTLQCSVSTSKMVLHFQIKICFHFRRQTQNITVLVLGSERWFLSRIPVLDPPLGYIC